MVKWERCQTGWESDKISELPSTALFYMCLQDNPMMSHHYQDKMVVSYRDIGFTIIAPPIPIATLTLELYINVLSEFHISLNLQLYPQALLI